MRGIANVRALISVALLVLLGTGADEALAQDSGNRIENFRAMDVSATELRVAVDYTYSGEFGTSDVTIAALPEEAGGVFDPRRVDFESFSLRAGAHAAVFVIKKRPEQGSFTTVSIRVCMSRPGLAILCQNFPHAKTWGRMTPTDPGVCSFSGRLFGRLEWVVRDPQGRPHRFRLRDVLLRTDGAPPIRAQVASGGNVARNVPASRVYRVTPANFRAQPRERVISCRPNLTHTGLNFTITGPPPLD